MTGTKKRVLLFNSPLVRERIDRVEEGGSTPRIGIASIAAYLAGKGVETTIVDSQDRSFIESRLRAFKPRIVGIPAYTPEVFDSAYTASLVKETVPQALVAIGGPHPSAMARETLEEFPEFDVAVAGEGEETMAELALGEKPFHEVAGIAFRSEGTIKVTRARKVIPDLDSIPFPAWELYDMEKYRTSEDQREGIFNFRSKRVRTPVQVEAARGCPFDCIFCFRIAGRVMRYRTPRLIAEEVERCVGRYGKIKVYFVEGTFGVNRERTLELCDEFLERGLEKEVIWEASTRVDVVEREVLLRMKAAGCRNIGLGVESGDPEILKKIGKNTTPEEILKAVELCNEVGLPVGTTFILGHPYESEESIMRTIRFAKTLPVATANFAIMVPFPGTRVREMAEKGVGGLRIKSNDWRYYGKQVGYSMDSKQMPYEKLVSYQNRAYREFYLRPGRIKFFLHHLTWDRAKFAVKRMVGLN